MKIDVRFTKRKNRIRLFQLMLLLLISLGGALQAQPLKKFDKTFGGSGNETGRVFLKTADGGYLLGGHSDSDAEPGSTKEAQAFGGADFWLLKFDANHVKQWEKTYGGTDDEELRAIVATTDGYLLGGHSYSSNDGNKSSTSFGEADYWVVKIDFNGVKQWDKSFGGNRIDNLRSIAVTLDGKFLLGGYSESAVNGNKTAAYKGDYDFWIVKIDASGNREWDQTFGGSLEEELRMIVPTADGNYLLGGVSISFASPVEDLTGKTENNKGSNDYWVVKIKPDGTKIWDKTIGGNKFEYLYSIEVTPDGGYVLAGYSDSGKSGDKSEDFRGDENDPLDYWIVKVDNTNKVSWDRTLGGTLNDRCYALLSTSDGGFLVGGWSMSDSGHEKTADSKGGRDIWIVKLQADGTTQWDRTLGGDEDDELFALMEPTAGAFLLTGVSASATNDGDKTAPHRGEDDLWLILLEGSCAPSDIAITSNVSTHPIFQNTPGVSLSVTGCTSGTVTWKGSNNTSGTGTTISVPTSAIGTLVYSATCTLGSCSSPPGSATIIITAPTETGSFDGFIYGADCSTFRGWAWDRSKPNTVFSVDIFDGPNYVTTIPANEFRQDLKDAGKGNGIHAFRWTIPESLKDGQVHYLSARIKDSGFFLKDSPKALICQGGTVPPPTNKQPVAPTMTALTAQQGVAFTTTLPAFTDPEGSILSYGLVSLPIGLTFTSATRQISGTPTASGLFVLTYSATDDKGATNSVSFKLTVNPTATTPVTGSFEGYLDKVECGTIRGWVWDRNKPNTPLTVEFYTDGAVWGSVVANIYRVDLKNAGKGNGAHAYSFEVPNELKNNTTHLIRARVSGSTYDLKDSGKPLTCPSPVRLSAESSEGLQVTVLGNPVSDQVVVEIRGAEYQPLRWQLTDASGRIFQEHQIEAAKPVERQTVSIQNQPPGLLLLRVDTNGKSHTLKIMKR
ncbi:putative Ig domain-containing protein [Larkinella sp. GY13]|uniref:putative Ig domain-containing protein n=1 Tax=Larkinella sp. GY13 TaxID=3453720 RepID=UPI003EE83AA5